MALQYTVKHGFHHKGVFYTRANEGDVVKLPREIRDELIKRKRIIEHDDRAAAEPAAPATTGKGK